MPGSGACANMSGANMNFGNMIFEAAGRGDGTDVRAASIPWPPSRDVSAERAAQSFGEVCADRAACAGRATKRRKMAGVKTALRGIQQIVDELKVHPAEYQDLSSSDEADDPVGGAAGPTRREAGAAGAAGAAGGAEPGTPPVRSRSAPPAGPSRKPLDSGR